MLSLADADDGSVCLFEALWASGYDASRASAVDPVNGVALPLSWTIAAARCVTASPTLSVRESSSGPRGAAQKMMATLTEVSDLLLEDGRGLVAWWMDRDSPDTRTTEHGTFRHTGDGRLRDGDGDAWPPNLWLHVHARRQTRTLLLHSLDGGVTAEGAGLCVHFDSPLAVVRKKPAESPMLESPQRESPAPKAKWESADSPVTCVRRRGGPRHV